MGKKSRGLPIVPYGVGKNLQKESPVGEPSPRDQAAPTGPRHLERCGRGRWRWAGGEKSKFPPPLTNSAPGFRFLIGAQTDRGSRYSETRLLISATCSFPILWPRVVRREKRSTAL